MKKMELRIVAFAACCIMALSAVAQTTAPQRVSFKVNDGIYNLTLKQKLEQTVSGLLTEANRASLEGTPLRLGMLNMTAEARNDMTMLWTNIHFVCEESEIVEHCLTNSHGYQIRRLPIMMRPAEDIEGREPEYQEAVINFNKQGQMESFYLTVNMQMYSNVLTGENEITDQRRRMEIRDYVEQFRTAYETKDLKFMQQVFSEDALIITGRVIKTKKSEVFPAGNKVIYKQQTKQEYLTNLAAAFRSNRYIRVKFDNVHIESHPTDKNVYAVTLRQEWNTQRYSDEGYVFMIWDFTNPDEPQIHVRTWQPEWIDKTKSQKLNPNDIFTLGDFVLPSNDSENYETIN
jgi:hypothetical protein